MKSTTISIPRELTTKHKNITLCIDTIFVNGMCFLASIDRTIKFRQVRFLPHREKSAYQDAISALIREYNKAGFLVRDLLCDNEYLPLKEWLESRISGLRMNCCNAGDHVPEAERNNRVIKERVRIAFHVLPFKILPRVMVKALVHVATVRLNWFPVKLGASPYYSPHVIMGRRTLDFRKDCAYSLGSYVQANHDPTYTNSTEGRTLDAIYLYPN